VITKHLGSVALKDVQVGDQVLTQNGKFESVVLFSRHWNAVASWARDDTAVQVEYFHFSTAFLNGTKGPEFSMSSGHLLPVFKTITCSESLMAPASSLIAERDFVVGASGDCLKVTGSHVQRGVGAFSPLTKSTFIVVDGIVASCLTEESIDPRVAKVLLRVMDLVQRAVPKGFYETLVDVLDYLLAVKVHHGFLALCMAFLAKQFVSLR